MTRLEQERRRRAWTQTTLAYKARLTQGDISEIETGRRVPGPKPMARLAKVLGLSADELLAEVTQEATNVR